MSLKCKEGVTDNCAILFFILLFLMLFTGRKFWGRTETNEVE